MKHGIRIIPVLISLVVSAAVLFGGWFAYHGLALEAPLQALIADEPGVEQADVTIGRKKAEISLHLTEEANLYQIMQTIRDKGKHAIENRQIEWHIRNANTSPALEAWWGWTLFQVAEAMETKQYSLIPRALQEHQALLPGLVYEAAMDERYVYIKLQHEGAAKHIVLPRVPIAGGGGRNE